MAVLGIINSNLTSNQQRSKSTKSSIPLVKKWHSIKLQDIYKSFKDGCTISKMDMVAALPIILLTEAKKKYIITMPDMVNINKLVKFLEYQTAGSNYINFDAIREYYNLDFDTNHCLMCTDAYPFSNNIKKEAFFIYNIDNAIKNHPILSQFNSRYLIFETQATFELKHLTNICKMKWDMCFRSLGIIVEIDENHSTVDKINDELKDKITRQNGFTTERLDFQQIYSGNIMSGQNINSKMKDSIYYKEFLEKLCNKLINAVLKKYKQARQVYIMHLFKSSLLDKIDMHTEIINENIKAKNIILVELETFESEEQYTEIMIRLENMNKNIKLDVDFCKEKQIQLNSLHESTDKSDFITLFKFKDRYRLTSLTKKLISFKETTDLIDIKKNNHQEFKEFLNDLRIITDINTLSDDILFNWKELNLILLEFNFNKNLQTLLKLYFIEVQESYEIIINLINEHNKLIIGNEDSYIECMEQAVIKYKKDSTTTIRLQANKIIELQTNVDKLLIDNQLFTERLVIADKICVEYELLTEEAKHIKTEPVVVSNTPYIKAVEMPSTNILADALIKFNKLKITKEFITETVQEPDNTDTDSDSSSDSEPIKDTFED